MAFLLLVHDALLVCLPTILSLGEFPKEPDLSNSVRMGGFDEAVPTATEPRKMKGKSQEIWHFVNIRI
jgi:hypothetical protein